MGLLGLVHLHLLKICGLLLLLHVRLGLLLGLSWSLVRSGLASHSLVSRLRRRVPSSGSAGGNNHLPGLLCHETSHLLVFDALHARRKLGEVGGLSHARVHHALALLLEGLLTALLLHHGGLVGVLAGGSTLLLQTVHVGLQHVKRLRLEEPQERVLALGLKLGKLVLRQSLLQLHPRVGLLRLGGLGHELRRKIHDLGFVGLRESRHFDGDGLGLWSVRGHAHGLLVRHAAAAAPSLHAHAHAHLLLLLGLLLLKLLRYLRCLHLMLEVLEALLGVLAHAPTHLRLHAHHSLRLGGLCSLGLGVQRILEIRLVLLSFLEELHDLAVHSCIVRFL